MGNRIEEKSIELSGYLNNILCFRINFIGYSISLNNVSGISVSYSIQDVLFILKNRGFLSDKFVPTRNLKFLNYELFEIICKFRKVELDLLKFYIFSDNFYDILKKVYYYLKYSCALTICSKMKLKTLRK